jgi:glutathione synthase/RimK-type ligase-like ATP-grasp enzyme
MKIGFITCAADKLSYFFPTAAEPHFIPVEPPFLPDDQIAVDALRQQGHVVQSVVWNSPVSTLKAYDLLVMRSPWDYMDSEVTKSRFMAWMGELVQAGLRVANPVQLMQWLLDKHYLQDLAAEGVAVIATQYLEIGSTVDLVDHFERHGQFVLKPCISAGGMGLYHIKTRDDAVHYQVEINRCLQTDSYMLQEFIEEITERGEWSLIYLGGQYSHALHKKPGPDSILVHAERGGSLAFAEPSESTLIRFANAVYKKVIPAFTRATAQHCDPRLVLYMRFDILETKRGPVLIECEGVEPELFFRAKPGSERQFCEAVGQLI